MNIDEVKSRISLLLGQKAWGVSLGVGSFLTLEFGQPLSNTNGHQHVHGEWHLWIYNCVWRLEEAGKVLAASEDERNKIESAIVRLEGLSLQSIDLQPPIWDTVFTFENQVILRLFSIYSEDYEHWMLYTPDGNVLSLGPGSNWSYDSEAIPA
ncbi:hypothetical protein NIES4071_63000 [Calothrix sp. NIES-4071]|nr:hypothetical protein NIES4071_63000 [Calothrix sp. NIES-4071]BAZ60603.1 hypothetical protein NIES4105_62950 [Calothrix sp. NIES-4105]